MKTDIIGTVNSKAHREYFLKEFKRRFGHVRFKEESEQKGKEEQIVLTIQSPSKNLGDLRVFLSNYEITIAFPQISFHTHFDIANSIHHVAPDADASIPARISALDFINKMIDDRLFVRCYKRKGIIETATVIDVATGKLQDTQFTFSRPLKSLFLKYEKEDYYWSGKQSL
jgi:hypothetical protein